MEVKFVVFPAFFDETRWLLGGGSPAPSVDAPQADQPGDQPWQPEDLGGSTRGTESRDSGSWDVSFGRKTMQKISEKHRVQLSKPPTLSEIAMWKAEISLEKSNPTIGWWEKVLGRLPLYFIGLKVPNRNKKPGLV